MKSVSFTIKTKALVLKPSADSVPHLKSLIFLSNIWGAL